MRRSIPGQVVVSEKMTKQMAKEESIEEYMAMVEKNKEDFPEKNHGIMPVPNGTGFYPSKMTPSCVEEIMERIARGESITSIGKESHLPAAHTIWQWIRKNENFARLYHEAKKLQMDMYAEDIINIADDSVGDIRMAYDKFGNKIPEVNFESVKRSELRVKARQWLMERLAPKKYNERNLSESGPDANSPSINATIKIMLPDNGRPIASIEPQTIEVTSE